MVRNPAEGHDTAAIYAAAIEAVGAKRVAHALGLSLSHVYRLQRPTMDVDPDGTGARSDLDRVEALADLLAARPEGRPVLVAMRGFFDALFDRALGAWGGEGLSRDAFTRQTSRATVEFGEMLARCDWDRLEPDALAKEAAEAIAAIETLVRTVKERQEERVRRIG